jgi:hypothetical protein
MLYMQASCDLCVWCRGATWVCGVCRAHAGETPGETSAQTEAGSRRLRGGGQQALARSDGGSRAGSRCTVHWR